MERVTLLNLLNWHARLTLSGRCQHQQFLIAGLCAGRSSSRNMGMPASSSFNPARNGLPKAECDPTGRRSRHL
jgi:hypothetical protein